MTIQDSGERQRFDTGSQRDIREGKGRFDLLPPKAIKRVAKHFENGAKKYDERNWELGQPLSRYVDSALRHVFSYLDNLTDEDHLAAAAWNLLCLIETEERITKLHLPESLRDLPNPNLTSRGPTPPPHAANPNQKRACSRCGETMMPDLGDYCFECGATTSTYALPHPLRP